MRRLALFLFCTFLCCASLLAQVSIDVTLVEVPVNIVDRDGVPVRGLSAADFEVLDNGTRRPLTHFNVIDRGPRPASAAAALTTPPPPAEKRNFLLLFDLDNSAPGSLRRAREAAAAFLDRKAQRTDRVAVGAFSSQGGFQLLAAFTTDRTVARRAVESLNGPAMFVPTDPLRLTTSEFWQAAEAAAKETGGKLGTAIADAYKEKAYHNAKQASQELRQRVARDLSEIEQLGRDLDRVKGRKHVILLSEGFDAKMLSGREKFNTDEQKFEREAIESGDVWNVDNDNRFGNSSSMTLLQRMIESLRRSDVVLDAIDIKGVRSDVTLDDGIENLSNESLHLLTRDTGGTVFKNSNDLGADFDRMLRSQEVTYVLGFQVPTTSPGRFHNLRVRVKGLRGAKITHRPGYYEPSPAKTALDQTLSAGDIIMNALPVDDVKIRMLVNAFGRGTGPAVVPVVLEVNGQSLANGMTTGSLAADVFIYAFDANETIRDFVHERMTIDIGKAGDPFSKHGAKLYNVLRLGPGDYSIRALVRPSGGDRNGFQSASIHVPAPGEPAIARPMVFENDRDWLMVKGIDRGEPYPFDVAGDPFIPAAFPAVWGGRTYRVAVVTSNLDLDHLQLSAELKDAAGSSHPLKVSLVGRTLPDSFGSSKIVLEMTIPESGPGPYALNVSARDSAGVQQASLPVEMK